MTLNLSDPRQYSNIFPDSNMLISQAQADLNNNSDNSLMVALIEDLLKREQDEFLSVAYNLAPNKSIADYILSSLQSAVNNGKVSFFAIPVILVIGSGSKATVKTILDAEALNQLLLTKEVFGKTQNSFISASLYSPDDIVRLKPSYLYKQQQSPVDFSLFNKSVSDIENLGENVYLRYIVGYADIVEGSSFNKRKFDTLGLELMQFVTEALKTVGATIFPIPFPPCNLSEAAYLGERYRKEIHISLRLSNQVRQMRQTGKNPEVRLKTVDETIKVELWDNISMKPVEILSWHLERGDDFELVCSILNGLFVDMQLAVSYE